MRRACTAIAVVFIAFVCIHPSAKGEDPYEFADRDGIWTPIKTGDEAFASIALPSADRSVVVKKREAIFEILAASKVFIPFKGVVLRADKTVVSRADTQGRAPTSTPVVTRIGMTIGKFRRNSKTGRIDPFTIEQPRIEIYTNDIYMTAGTWSANRLWYEGLRDDQGQDLFLEPHSVARTDGGLHIYQLDAHMEEVVLTNGRPLWIPVTSEHFLRAMMTDTRGGRAEEIEQSRQSGGQPLTDQQSFFAQRLRSLDQELAALTPAERQQPAYYLRSENPMHSGLAMANTRWARLVVMINPDYFDRLLPRTAVQLIACQYNYQLPHSSADPKGGKTGINIEMLGHLAKRLEYEKLMALIEGAK